MSIIRSLVLFISMVVALEASDASVQPFVYYSTYDTSFKDTDTGMGVYTSFKTDVSEWKFGAEYRTVTYRTNLDFLDNNNTDDNQTTDTPTDTPDTNNTDGNTTAITEDTNTTDSLGYSDSYQGDFIIGYERKLSKYVLFNAAFHYTVSDLYQADQNKIFVVGASYSKPYRFKVGMDAAYSIYNDKSLASEVMQFAPYFASWFGEPKSMMGRFYYKLTYYYTRPIKPNVALSSSYNHFEFSLYQHSKRFVNRIAFAFGESIHLVKDQGFTVYNNNEIHDKGFLLSSTYRFSNRLDLRLAYVYESFREYNPLLTASTDSAKMNRFVFAGILKF